MKKTLLVVDIQSGFINSFTHHIPKRVVNLMKQNDYDSILWTRFVNSSESPYCRFLDWHGCAEKPDNEIVKELNCFVNPSLVFPKHGLCGLPNKLINYLQQQEISQVYIVGIDTDMCVLKVAMDVFDLGIEPIVLTDCCASTAGLQAHLAGLAVLSRNIGATRLQQAGLGGGMLAAPS